MTHEEAKRAFYHKIPVEYAGTQYLYIQALRYCWQRNGEGSGPLMQLELLDPKGNSVVVIPPKKAHLAGKLPGGEPPADGETLYEWQGIRMVKSGAEYIVTGPENTVKASKNPLVAWTSFADLLDSRVRRKIGDKLLLQKRNRYTGEEETA